MMQLALNLLLNTSLLVSIGIVFNRFYQKFQNQRLFFQMLNGAVLGFAGIVVMSIAFKLPNGTIFDTRTILLFISGLFYGFVPTSIASLIIIAYRVFLGGPGVYMGIAVTITSAAVGIHLRKISKKPENISGLKIYIYALANHFIMLLCAFLLPQSLVWETLKSISIPVLIIFPLGTLVLSLIVIDEKASVVTEMKLTESEFQFQAVYEQAPIGIVVATPEKTLFANQEVAKILRMPLDKLVNVDWKTYNHPDDLEVELTFFDQMIAGQIDQYDMVKRYIPDDGELIWTHIFVKVFSRNVDPQYTKYIVLIQNITNDVENELHRKESSLFLATLIDSIPDHIFYKNKDGYYLGCNEAFEKASGISKEKLVGKNDFALYDLKTAQTFIESDRKALEGTEEAKTEETVQNPDGKKIITETLKKRYLDTNGNVSGIIGISRDITERILEKEKIEFLNIHDVMTGLYNRMYFDNELDRIDALEELPYSIISADIDSLKLTNDMFGHRTGDQLIIRTANILRDCCGDGIVARIGGDEFSILLPGVDENELKNYVNVIRLTIEEEKSEYSEISTMLSISWGYATKTRRDQTIADIINTAEENMYRRKLMKHQSIRSTLLVTIKELLFSKGNETKEHADRMARHASILGAELGLSDTEMDSLELMATLHDVGKIGISSHILQKPGKLDAAEWLEIKKHPEIGYRIALTVPELHGIAEYILCHHERWDGTGYPQGLAGTEIPYISRLISVIDAYDAMTEDRAYRKAMSRDEALKEILDHAGTQFDPNIAKTFVKSVLRLEP